MDVLPPVVDAAHLVMSGGTLLMCVLAVVNVEYLGMDAVHPMMHATSLVIDAVPLVLDAAPPVLEAWPQVLDAVPQVMDVVPP